MKALRDEILDTGRMLKPPTTLILMKAPSIRRASFCRKIYARTYLSLSEDFVGSECLELLLEIVDVLAVAYNVDGLDAP